MITSNVGMSEVTMKPLLEQLSLVALPELKTGTKARKLFVEDTSVKARAKILLISGDFLKWFGEMTVGPTRGSPLSIYRLTRSAGNRELMTFLGGRELALTTLAEFWLFLVQQPPDRCERVFTDAKTNVFFIRDQKGEIRAVNVSWTLKGWIMSAFAYDDFLWHVGRRMIVRSPVAPTDVVKTGTLFWRKR